jgi:hypothetical protein
MGLGLNALTTVINVKSFLGLSTGSTGDDTLLENLINVATDMIEGQYCNRPFINVATSSSTTLQAQTEYYDGGGKAFFIKYYPISSITSIYDDPDRVYTDTGDAIDSTSYVLYENEGRILLDYKSIYQTHSVKVVYTGGYTTGTLPYDIEFAAWELTGLLYKSRDSLGVSGKSFSDGSVNYYENRLSFFAKDTFSKYRNYNV